MTDLITEARELCEYSEKIVNQLHTERLDCELEYIPLIETIQVTSELCDALEKAEEQNKQLLREVCKLARESVEREKKQARLEAEVMAACDSVRWIPVTERLPEDFAIVQIVEDNGYKWLPRIGEYRKNLDKWRAEGTFEHSNGWLEDTKMFKVTHWMPLPAAPEEGE